MSVDMGTQWWILLQFCAVLVFDKPIVNGDSSNVARLNRVDCIDPDMNYFSNNISCRVKAVRRDSYLMNIYAFVYNPIDKIWIHMKLLKKGNTYKPFLVDFTENFCDFLSERKHTSVYMRVVGSLYLPYSNVNKSCPLEGELLFKDLSINAKMLPSIWPTGEYRFEIELLRLEKIIVTIRIDFSLGEKLKTI